MCAQSLWRSTGIDNEILLCYDEFAFYINRYGHRSRKKLLVHYPPVPRIQAHRDPQRRNGIDFPSPPIQQPTLFIQRHASLAQQAFHMSQRGSRDCLGVLVQRKSRPGPGPGCCRRVQTGQRSELRAEYRPAPPRRLCIRACR
ncbi:hypothetical protein V8E53_012321 [Lactarius tabidus]